MKEKLSSRDKNLFERNIFLTYLRGCFSWGRFFVPVLALFYIASQVSLEQFSIIFAVFSLSILILEIPTGVLADLLGKKKTLILSSLMYVIEVVIIAFFNGFWPLLIAKIISGMGVSLSSGTGSALIYDSLTRLGREEEHKKILGKLLYLTNISMAIVFITGAYLFTLYYKLPAYLSLPFLIANLVVAFFLKEPFNPSKKFNIKNAYAHLIEGLKSFLKNKYLVYLALFTLIIGSTISMMLSYSSTYYELIFIPVALIGVIAFVQSLLTAYSSRRAHKWEEKLGERKSLFFIQLIIILALLCMGFMLPKVGFVFLLIISFTGGFYSVLIGDYVNRHVKSSHRATMLSINNMFDNIGEFLLFPVLGFGIKSIGMGNTFTYFALFVVVYLVILWFVFRKVSSNS
ncbi:MAG: MFS transporter [Nanoarchaeota archaeon]